MKELIAQSRVIAKGERIRDIQRLVEQYGGKKSKWVKKSSPVFKSGGLLYEYSLSNSVQFSTYNSTIKFFVLTR